MYSIFVNYRRSEHSAMAVSALKQMLAHHFGHDEVFLDVDIPTGERYPGLIDERLHGCDVLVAVIHDGWDATFDEPRKKDWVSYEIATALEKGIPIIPVLLEDTPRPAWDKLPREIAGLSLFQNARLRSREIESDVDRLIQRLEHHVDLEPVEPPAKARPKRTGLRIAALALALFLVTPVVFFESGPLWWMFAFPAFGSAILLALCSSLTMIATWSLRGVAHRWERRGGTRTHRETLTKNWVFAALLILVSAYFASRPLIRDGSWQEWKLWFALLLILFASAYLHRWWRKATAGDEAWPPPVTSDHWVFRRAARRLHEKLTTDKKWRHPRSRTTQRQAESIYLDLVEAREELIARAALPVTRWLRNGYTGETIMYLGWLASVLMLDVAATAVLVLGDRVPGSPLWPIVITVGGATIFTAAMLTTNFLVDRYRVSQWVVELTEWQETLEPLVFGTHGPSASHI
jgi:hypothetical protein